MRALNSMSTQLAHAHFPRAQLLAAILLSLAIPLMLMPTSPYRPCTPPPPTMPRSANSHPHIFQPNHPARDTLHPHTTHTIPLPYQLFWMVLAFSRCPSKGLHTKSNVTASEPNAATQETHESHKTHTSHKQNHQDTTTKTHTRAEITAPRTCKKPRSPTPNLNLPPTL